jgi:hypothetical protein
MYISLHKMYNLGDFFMFWATFAHVSHTAHRTILICVVLLKGLLDYLIRGGRLHCHIQHIALRGSNSSIEYISILATTRSFVDPHDQHGTSCIGGLYLHPMDGPGPVFLKLS